MQGVSLKFKPTSIIAIMIDMYAIKDAEPCITFLICALHPVV